MNRWMFTKLLYALWQAGLLGDTRDRILIAMGALSNLEVLTNKAVAELATLKRGAQ